MTMAITKITATGSMVTFSSARDPRAYPARPEDVFAECGRLFPCGRIDRSGDQRRRGEQHDEQDHTDHQEDGPTGRVDRLVAIAAWVVGRPAGGTGE